MIFRQLLPAIVLMAGLQLHAQTTWHDKLIRALPALGHRNWIVVADPGYPLQSEGGIEVVATNLSQTDLLKAVLDALAGSPHVRPVFYTDAELPFVPEGDALGISAYRAQLATLLTGGAVASAPHETLMTQLENESRNYHVLVLKSTTTLPYISVFMRLEYGYWSADAEKRLRAAMAAKQ